MARSLASDDPRPAAGSFSMADVRRLSVHVIKLRGMPEGVLVLSWLSHFWKIRWTGAEVLEEPYLDDLAIGTPSSKILDKVEGSQKQKASTSGATSSHVTKRTRPDLARSSDSTTHPSFFMGVTPSRLPVFVLGPVSSFTPINRWQGLQWTGAEVIEEPYLDDLAVGTHSSKILDKVEGSQKQKASTSGATSSHVTKRTRPDLARSSDSTTHPSLYMGSNPKISQARPKLESPRANGGLR
nr:hypothetical protein [Tanacetum cinerariifolium]